MSEKIDGMLHYTNAGKRRNLSSGIWTFLLTSKVIAAVMWFLRRRKLQRTGRHKKHEFEGMAFPSGDGNVKYRDS